MDPSLTGVAVIAYFADDTTRTYQLVQWLDVLELLDTRHRVAVVVRDPASGATLAEQTSLPVRVAPSLTELTELYDDLDAAVVLYCNNSMLNFQSLLSSRQLHVHVNHGESDKQSMASNNAKAYDRVFVAGEAAVQRHLAALMELDEHKLVRVGRPQLDLRPPSLLPATDPGRRTVLYAPTWEGDADYNDYTSLTLLGERIVSAVVRVRDIRLVYKPHPKIVTSRTPAVRAAHRRVLAQVAEAAQRDPDAGHRALLEGDVLAVLPDCHALVTDVSSVGLDWLYLCTERPLFLTDPHGDADRLRTEVPVSRCADVVDEATVERLSTTIAERLDHDEHQLARTAMRHHYFDDLQIGESTVRFLDAVGELVALRHRLLGDPSRETGGAIPA